MSKSKRSINDKCLICLSDNSTETGSHIVPASLIQPCVGKHYSEHSFKIEYEKGEIDEFYGRDNLRNTSTEIKENHYKRDYIFCPTCEKKLGHLESKLAPELVQKFREGKFNSNYKELTNELGIKYKEFNRVNDNDFLIYFYSIVYRLSFDFEHDKNSILLSSDQLERLRKTIHEYLYESKIDKTIEQASSFAFNVFTKEEFNETDGTFVLTSDEWKKPNIFFLCEFIVFFYSIEEIHSAKKNPFGSLVNTYGEKSNVIILEDTVWDSITFQIKQIADDFKKIVGENLTKVNGKTIEENIGEYTSLVSLLMQQDIGKRNVNYTGQAISILNRKYTTQKHPGDVQNRQHYYFEGRKLVKNGKKEEAIEAYKNYSSHMLLKDMHIPFQWISQLYEELGEIENSLYYLRLFARGCSPQKSADLHKHVGEWYLKNDYKLFAKDCFEDAMLLNPNIGLKKKIEDLK
ncbi:MAG: hypothetical protein KDC34_10165 [Saprospiraceae bacterium]|nr:hypothetical protein [Saprospiraceae bacterium]